MCGGWGHKAEVCPKQKVMAGLEDEPEEEESREVGGVWTIGLLDKDGSAAEESNHSKCIKTLECRDTMPYPTCGGRDAKQTRA